MFSGLQRREKARNLSQEVNLFPVLSRGTLNGTHVESRLALLLLPDDGHFYSVRALVVPSFGDARQVLKHILFILYATLI